MPNSPAAPPAITLSPEYVPFAGNTATCCAAEKVAPASELVRMTRSVPVWNATSSVPPLPAIPKFTMPISSSG